MAPHTGLYEPGEAEAPRQPNLPNFDDHDTHELDDDFGDASAPLNKRSVLLHPEYGITLENQARINALITVLAPCARGLRPGLNHT